ncbi:MAK10-like protein [Tanacetum coccineum]
MGDENPIRTLGDYSKPSHEGYRNTIELPVGNNVVPLRSDTIRLVQNGCSFHGLRSEDPNQHLKDFLKLVDSLDLDGENRERTRMRLFQNSIRDQASNLLERLPAVAITTWEDLTTRFLAQFFPPGRTAKLRNDILMFQQHHGESLSEAWTRFKDLLQKVPHHGIDLWLQERRRILCMIIDPRPRYDNENWNDPRDFAKPVKAIALPQDVPSTSDHRLIELENQVQHLMEAHLAPTQPTQVNKITTSCEIYSGPHDTQYCMEDPEQAFVEYASSRTDEAGENEPEPTLEDEFQDLHLNLPLVEVLTHAPIYNSILDKYVESLELGKNGSAIVQGEVPTKMEDPELFTLPCEEEAPYWTTLGKMESYKPRPRSDGIGARTPYHARKDLLDCHLPGEWEIARDAELNPFKDTLVFRKMIKEEHEEHLKLILELLKKEELYAKFSKYNFWLSKPMTKLTQKSVKFDWGEKAKAAFQLLKQKLCSVPILALPEDSENFEVYYDASCKWLGAVLMQKEKVIRVLPTQDSREELCGKLEGGLNSLPLFNLRF